MYAVLATLEIGLGAGEREIGVVELAGGAEFALAGAAVKLADVHLGSERQARAVQLDRESVHMGWGRLRGEHPYMLFQHINTAKLEDTSSGS